MGVVHSTPETCRGMPPPSSGMPTPPHLPRHPADTAAPARQCLSLGSQCFSLARQCLALLWLCLHQVGARLGVCLQQTCTLSWRRLRPRVAPLCAGMRPHSSLVYLLWAAVLLWTAVLLLLTLPPAHPQLSQAQVFSINYRLRPIQVDLNFQVGDPPGSAQKGEDTEGREAGGEKQAPRAGGAPGDDKWKKWMAWKDEGKRRAHIPKAGKQETRVGRRDTFVYSSVPTLSEEEIARLVAEMRGARDMPGDVRRPEGVKGPGAEHGGRGYTRRGDGGHGDRRGGEGGFHAARKEVRHLLKLFTTMPEQEDRAPMHGNVLRAWGELAPGVVPVLYAEDPAGYWSRRAEMSGWEVRRVPRLRHDLPVIKDMFADIIAASEQPGASAAMFYGYANSDMLFDETLVATLRGLAATYPELSQRLLLTGRRTNVNISAIGGLTSGAQVAGLVAKGREGPENAQDYFVAARGAVKWDDLPDLVVGRPGWDNWLVAQAREWGLTVVDGTETITAVHQSGPDGDQAGWRSAPHLCSNRRLVAPFDYQAGFTHCTPYRSVKDAAGGVALIRREPVPSDCTPDPVRARDGERRGNPCP